MVLMEYVANHLQNEGCGTDRVIKSRIFEDKKYLTASRGYVQGGQRAGHIITACMPVVSIYAK